MNELQVWGPRKVWKYIDGSGTAKHPIKYISMKIFILDAALHLLELD